MKIGFDVSTFHAGAANGTATHMSRLVRAILATEPAARMVLLYNHRPTAAAAAILDELAGPRVEVVHGGFRRTGVPAAGFWMPRFPTVRRMVGDVDVFHGQDLVFPRPGDTPIVASVLDLIPQLLPETTTLVNRLRDRRKLRWVARSAERVVVSSQSAKDDLCRFTGVAADRVDVTPLARGTRAALAPAERDARVGAVRARYGIGSAPYVLSMGVADPRKNQLRLVEAFAGVAARLPEVRLVLVGARGGGAAPVERAVTASPAAGRIHLTGVVPDDDLVALYAGAAVFAFPSLYEGFGLPVLEAMAAGVPVVTSTVSSLPEVAGDAALLVDPARADAIGGALARVLTEPALARDLAARGAARERGFTWERTAAATVASYRAAIASHARRHAAR